MFCSKCGKEVSEGAQFCQHCGAACAIQTENAQSSKQETVQKLKNFKSVKNCICLECGYEGLMGVVGEKEYTKKQKKDLWLFRIAMAFILYMVLHRFPGWPFIFGILLVVVDSFYQGKAKKTILYCPSCEKEIIEK